MTLARVVVAIDGPFRVVLSSVGVTAMIGVALLVSNLLPDGPPSEITRWPIAAVTSDFIGVVMGVVISQGED